MNDNERKTEDEMAREKLGPQGVPGKPDVREKRPPKEDEQIPKSGEFDGHVA
jgi:hypothetical protein